MLSYIQETLLSTANVLSLRRCLSLLILKSSSLAFSSSAFFLEIISCASSFTLNSIKCLLAIGSMNKINQGYSILHACNFTSRRITHWPQYGLLLLPTHAYHLPLYWRGSNHWEGCLPRYKDCETA